MKDQNSIDEHETSFQKWDRAKAIFIESLIKPDNTLRSYAHNQKCYNELMEIRDKVLELTYSLHNPKKYVED